MDFGNLLIPRYFHVLTVQPGALAVTTYIKDAGEQTRAQGKSGWASGWGELLLFVVS